MKKFIIKIALKWLCDMILKDGFTHTNRCYCHIDEL